MKANKQNAVEGVPRRVRTLFRRGIQSVSAPPNATSEERALIDRIKINLIAAVDNFDRFADCVDGGDFNGELITLEEDGKR